MFIVTPSPKDMSIRGANRFLGHVIKCELDDYILVYLCKFYRKFEADTYLITQDRMKWLMNSDFKRGMIDPSPRKGFKRICSIPSKRRYKLPIIGKSETRDPLNRLGGGKEKIKRTTKKKSLRKNSKRGGKRRTRRTRRTRKISRRTRKSRQSKRRTKKN